MFDKLYYTEGVISQKAESNKINSFSLNSVAHDICGRK